MRKASAGAGSRAGSVQLEWMPMERRCAALPTPIADYIPHHEPFQYFAQTANPAHLPPASVDEIGHAGPANHQYDLADVWAAADAAKMPAVSPLQAAAY